MLKNYFRSLPDPLLTYDLHDQFIGAASVKDVEAKKVLLTDLVSKLPREHYNTTRALMQHLHRCVIACSSYCPVSLNASVCRVSEHSDRNLMHARNLGVVFGRKYFIFITKIDTR